MEETKSFGEYLFDLRTERGVTMQQLCNGLCDMGMLSRFERGEREPDRLIQDRLLSRLGIPLENYENFLYSEDYERWERRQDILWEIAEGHTAYAGRLIEGYQQEYPMKQTLEKQFILAMQAQVKRQEGCADGELEELFLQALLLTVPWARTEKILDKVVSMEEINLLMEWMRYDSRGFSARRYEELLDYIEKIQKTQLFMAKLYPKAVYYFYIAWKKQKKRSQTQAKKLLVLCEKAIGLLRDANRTYYLWELFGMEEELLRGMVDGSKEAERELEEKCREGREFRKTLEEIYEEYGASVKMRDFCYLYIAAETYCIGDIVRIRRRMLGMTMQQLCDGICSERTVSRLERNEKKPQKAVAVQLMERLGLSSEFMRTEIVTSSHQAKEQFKELKLAQNNRDLQRAEELLEELKRQLDMEISLNRQNMQRREAQQGKLKGILESVEYVEQMKEALGCTIPYQTLFSSGEKFFTLGEINCIRDIMLADGISRQEWKGCCSALRQLCESPEYRYRPRVAEFLLGEVASELGNNGNYDASDALELKVLKIGLNSRRISSLYFSIYDMLWNEEQRKKEGKPPCRRRDWREELKKCISLASLGHAAYLLKLFQEKLEKGV